MWNTVSMYPFAPVVDEVAELVDVMKIIPQELVQILAMAQLIGVPVPSIQEEIVGTELHRSGAEPPLTTSSRFPPPISQTL